MVRDAKDSSTTGYARIELDRVAETVTAYDAADLALAERAPLPPGVTARFSNFLDCIYHLFQLGNDPDNVMFLCDGLPP